MKIVTTRQTSTIHISEVDQLKHIVVAVIDGKPTILGKGYHESNKELSFLMLGANEPDRLIITSGNGYSYNSEDDNIGKMILRAMHYGHRVEVFEKQDWKNALQWLIDNAG